jgi:hypothetical protein
LPAGCKDSGFATDLQKAASVPRHTGAAHGDAASAVGNLGTVAAAAAVEVEVQGHLHHHMVQEDQGAASSPQACKISREKSVDGDH